MNIRAEKGIQPEHVDEAVRLYAIAFQAKFQKLLGGQDEVAELLKIGFNTDHALSAISQDNELSGIAGFHFNNGSLINIKIKHLMKRFGFIQGVFKFIILALLFYRKPDKKSQLLMDGIVVKKEFRGKGIGKLLFTELETFAKNNKLTSIKLDVIDENHNAKRLYERIGFVSRKHTRVPGMIFRLIGVSGVTTMIKEL